MTAMGTASTGASSSGTLKCHKVYFLDYTPATEMYLPPKQIEFTISQIF
jgi:hypothetical protein